jgi:hypothetical protein
MLDAGGKRARIVARTEKQKRDRFYEIARELRIDAPNIVNGLIDAFIETYERCGEVTFPLKIEIVESRVRQSENGDSNGEEERS